MLTVLVSAPSSCPPRPCQRRAGWRGRGAASAHQPGLCAARALALPGQSSRREAAKALCAATARRPDHRATHVDRAASCMAAGAANARWPASNRSHMASVLNLPPTSTPLTTKRQRRARTSSGYASRLSRRAVTKSAWPGCVSAPGRAAPARVTGLTMVTSTAC